MRTGREYEEVVVLTRPDGTALKLKDVATVVDGFEDTDLISRFNGQPAAVVQVFRIGDQNASTFPPMSTSTSRTNARPCRRGSTSATPSTTRASCAAA